MKQVNELASQKAVQIQNWPQNIKLVRQSQIVQSVMQDCQCVLSHLLPVCNLLVQGQKITYNHYYFVNTVLNFTVVFFVKFCSF